MLLLNVPAPHFSFHSQPVFFLFFRPDSAFFPPSNHTCVRRHLVTTKHSNNVQKCKADAEPTTLQTVDEEPDEADDDGSESDDDEEEIEGAAV